MLSFRLTVRWEVGIDETPDKERKGHRSGGEIDSVSHVPTPRPAERDGTALHDSGLGLHNMDWADYLRDEAAKYRQLAEQTDDPVIKNEMLELASVCEEVANNIEDRLTGG